MKIEPNNIYQGDCLELMKHIPDKSVDMILCDLPYGVTACRWDSIIPIDKLFNEYLRIIKEKSAIVLTATQPFASRLIYENIKYFKYDWIWNKGLSGNFMLAKNRPMLITESILIFSIGACRYFPIMKKGVERIKGGGGVGGNPFGGIKLTSSINDSYYPKNIIFISNTDRKNTLHPTQKPVALFEYLIKTYTKAGETVLDNCIGSGTTAIACINTGRNYIGMEKDPEIYKTAVKRVDDYRKLLKQKKQFSVYK